MSLVSILHMAGAQRRRCFVQQSLAFGVASPGGPPHGTSGQLARLWACTK